MLRKISTLAIAIAVSLPAFAHEHETAEMQPQMPAPIEMNGELVDQMVAIMETGALDHVLEKRMLKVSQNIAKRRAMEEAQAREDKIKAIAEAAKVHMPFGDYENDAVRGEAGTKFTIVEYSDYSCPYCARFHDSAKDAIEAIEGVNWVYRHFPIRGDSAPSAQLAYAAECVKNMAGNDAFWAFSDQVFAENVARSGDIDQFLSQFAQENKIDHEQLVSCQSSDETKAAVMQSAANAQASKLTGTPAVIIRNNETGELKVVPGAVDVDYLQNAVNEMS